MSDFSTEEGRWKQKPQSGTEEPTTHLYSARPVASTWYPEEPETEEIAPQTYTPNEPERLSPPATWDKPKVDQSAYLPNEPVGPVSTAYYQRGRAQLEAEEEMTAEEWSAKFAPPPRFEMPAYRYEEPPEEGPAVSYMPQANVYQPKAATWAETARRESLSLRQSIYQVEGEQARPAKRRRKKRRMKRLLAVLCVVAVLGVGAYLSRDWLSQQLQTLTGGGQVVGVSDPDTAVTAAQVKGYDPAPENRISEKARTGIAAISGTLPMDTFAVTNSNVVTRIPAGDGLYDYYLFSSVDGQLLGYYEGLPSTGFLVQQGDSFYVRQPPYLLSGKGKALIDSAAYAQYVGKEGLLHPLMGGWAIVSNPQGDDMNYISREGKLHSSLWFCRAFPFTGERTVAYVDTGNLANTAERYTLYVLSASGEMERWQHAADPTGVVGSACGMAYLSTGELFDLRDISAPLCATDDVSIYLDCDAMVVKSKETGKYGLFVGGEQHYDYEYDHIAPVECEIQWKQNGDSRFKLWAVTEATYPQPLSHYFTLEKDGVKELVALSTRSVYPIAMDD